MRGVFFLGGPEFGIVNDKGTPLKHFTEIQAGEIGGPICPDICLDIYPIFETTSHDLGPQNVAEEGTSPYFREI